MVILIRFIVDRILLSNQARSDDTSSNCERPADYMDGKLDMEYEMKQGKFQPVALYHGFIIVKGLHALIAIAHQDDIPNFAEAELMDRFVTRDFGRFLKDQNEKPFIYHLTYRDYEQRTYTITRDFDKTYSYLLEGLPRIYYCGSVRSHPQLFDLIALKGRPMNYQIFENDCVEYVKRFIYLFWSLHRIPYNEHDFDRLGKLSAVNVASSRETEASARGKGGSSQALLREVVENPLQIIAIIFLFIIILLLLCDIRLR